MNYQMKLNIIKEKSLFYNFKIISFVFIIVSYFLNN